MAVTLPTVGGSSGTWGTTLNAAFDEILNSGRTALEYPIYDKGGRVYDMAAYGTALDGSTDDRAILQTVVDLAGAAGGGTVTWRGTLRLGSATIGAAGGTPAGIAISYDNVTIDGFGGDTVLLNTIPAVSGIEVATFFLSGPAKAARVATGSVATWYDYHPTDLTAAEAPVVYDLTGTQERNAVTLQLDTAYPDDSLLPVGTWIIVRTGQTLDGINYQPVGEYNRVAAYNDSTGVVTLAWPLKHRYTQEYYISGTSGRTSESVTANLAPYGISPVSDRILHGFRLRNLHIDHRNNQSAIYGTAAINPVVDGITGDIESGSFWGVGACYQPVWRRSNVRTYGQTGATYLWAIDTCGTDGRVEDVTAAGDGTHVPHLHIHEGANATLKNVTMNYPSVNADQNLVSIRARAGNSRVEGCEFNGGGFVQVYVDPSCTEGGYIGGNIHRSPDHTSIAVAVNDGAMGWTVAPSQVHDGLTTEVVDQDANTLVGSPITLPARLFTVTTGTAGAGTFVPNTGIGMYEMPDGVQTGISTSLAIPPDWRKFDVYISCCNLGTGSGTFETAIQVWQTAVGGDMDAAPVITSQAATHTAGAQYERMLVRAGAVMATHVPGADYGIAVYRQATGTLTDHLGFTTIFIVRTA